MEFSVPPTSPPEYVAPTRRAKTPQNKPRQTAKYRLELYSPIAIAYASSVPEV
jgi:hypothetical protein